MIAETKYIGDYLGEFLVGPLGYADYKASQITSDTDLCADWGWRITEEREAMEQQIADPTSSTRNAISLSLSTIMLKIARGFSVGPCVGLVRDAEHPTRSQSLNVHFI